MKQKDPVQATPEQKNQYNKILMGMQTAAGVPVRSIKGHAYNRAVERGATPEEIAEALAQPEVTLPKYEKKGKLPTFKTGDVKVAFDPDTGQIRTIMKGEEE